VILAIATLAVADAVEAFESSSFNALLLHWQRNSGMWAFYVTVVEDSRLARKRNARPAVSRLASPARG